MHPFTHIKRIGRKPNLGATNMATKKKPPVFYAGTLRALWVIAFLFAAFGAVGWLATFWDVNKFLAVGMSLVFLGVPLAAAAVTGPLVHSKGFLVHTLLAFAICGLAAVDAAGNTRAFWQFEAIYGADEVAAFNAKVVADTADAKSRLDTATAALSGIVLKERECWCPDTRGADLKQFEALRGPHLEDRTRAQNDLREIGERTPPNPRLLPKEISAAVALIISFALIFAFLGTHIAAKRKLDEWTEAEALAKEARLKANRRKTPGKREPKAKKEPEAKPWTPKVVANDVG